MSKPFGLIRPYKGLGDAIAASPDGHLLCEVPGCGFDFETRYGRIGRGFAHVHHKIPLSRAAGPMLPQLQRKYPFTSVWKGCRWASDMWPPFFPCPGLRTLSGRQRPCCIELLLVSRFAADGNRSCKTSAAFRSSILLGVCCMRSKFGICSC